MLPLITVRLGEITSMPLFIQSTYLTTPTAGGSEQVALRAWAGMVINKIRSVTHSDWLPNRPSSSLFSPVSHGLGGRAVNNNAAWVHVAVNGGREGVQIDGLRRLWVYRGACCERRSSKK